MRHAPGNQFLDDINQNMGIIYKICHVYFINDEDRQDARQEILYQLWKSYAGYKGNAKFSTWMYKVALNTAITYSKKGSTGSARELSKADSDQIAETSEQPHTDEKINFLYRAINTLSDIDKAVILLQLDDHNYEEIAGITGLSKGNVSVRLVRIKEKLKEKLKNII